MDGFCLLLGNQSYTNLVSGFVGTSAHGHDHHKETCGHDHGHDKQ
jgi:hypothetical protein